MDSGLSSITATEIHDRLLAHVTACLPPTDWRYADRLVRDIWALALTTGDRSTAGVDADSELPAWLAAAARTVLRRHLHPAGVLADQLTAPVVRVVRVAEVRQLHTVLSQHSVVDAPVAA
ncbi:hypothetical protein E1265_25205 [Streptomyces sp. 8K308]|uniref:hypothetical protein n=1 Tax=Streptomyces sp. 8K308 TaxID=2530388 RepID=UPI0010432F71|nr:hypothetical protein [Streptomyces sp. 8K308]TDC18415.1 hypothetical protein E1265_25205 [Streptomyces sp. 8K308]